MSTFFTLYIHIRAGISLVSIGAQIYCYSIIYTYSSVFYFEGEAQREPALKLVASLIGQVGMEFILPPNTKDNKVLLMIIHLSCIEVRITLENLPIQKVSVNLIVTISLSSHIPLYSTQSLIMCFYL